MLVTIFGFPPAFQLLAKRMIIEAIVTTCNVDSRLIKLNFSPVPIRKPWQHGPARLLATGELARRHEEKITNAVAMACEEYFGQRGGYMYNFWFNFEEPRMFNQVR